MVLLSPQPIPRSLRVHCSLRRGCQQYWTIRFVLCAFSGRLKHDRQHDRHLRHSEASGGYARRAQRIAPTISVHSFLLRGLGSSFPLSPTPLPAVPLSTLAASPCSADGIGNSLFHATGDLIFPTGDGARGDLSAYAEGVGRLQVDMVATEVTGGSGDVDVNVALQDLGTVFEGAECHVKTAVGYAPGAHSPLFCVVDSSPRDAAAKSEC